MSKGLEAFNKFCDDVDACANSGGIHYIDMRNKEVIEKELKEGENYKEMYRLEHIKNLQLTQANFDMLIELKDYQEIREIAKQYNWDDITSEIFNVKTDKKYRDLFNSAIVNIQEDYRKARAFEITLKKDFIDLKLLKKCKTHYEYNRQVAIRYDSRGLDIGLLTKEEFEYVKKVVENESYN